MYKLVLAVGLTGGHIYPAKALVEHLGLEELEPLFVVRNQSPLAKMLLEDEGFSVLALNTRGMPRGLSSWMRHGISFVLSQFQSFFLVRRALKDWKPHLAIGFGGYVSFPVLAAAKLLGIKTLIFEPNAKMGIANKVLSHFVDKVSSVLIEDSEMKNRSSKFIQVAPILRQSLVAAKEIPAVRAREMLGMKPDVAFILIVGGSQGAASLNAAACQSLAMLKSEGFNFQFLHLAGRLGMQQVEEFYKTHGFLEEAHVREYFEEMGLAYQAAAVAISRAGAMTVLELMYFEVPCILVPLPLAAESHQRENAYYLEHLGIARIIEEGPELAPELTRALKNSLDGRIIKRVPLKREGLAPKFPEVVMNLLRQ